LVVYPKNVSRSDDFSYQACFFLIWGVVAPRLMPKLEDHPFSFVCDCLLNIFAATLHCWRPCLHPQTEDTPCYGDKRPTYHTDAYPKINFRINKRLYWLYVVYKTYDHRWSLYVSTTTVLFTNNK
jgi:hypothetical protein